MYYKQHITWPAPYHKTLKPKFLSEAKYCSHFKAFLAEIFSHFYFGKSKRVQISLSDWMRLNTQGYILHFQ